MRLPFRKKKDRMQTIVDEVIRAKYKMYKEREKKAKSRNVEYIQ